MKVLVDVKRAGQDFDLDTFSQKNYLVFEFAGIEVRVPCTEEQLAAAVAECAKRRGDAPAPAAQVPPVATPVEVERVFRYEEAEEEPVAESPVMFVMPEAQAASVAAPALRPVSRKPVRSSDDVGIAQG